MLVSTPRTALVTGAGRGIGREIAVQLAAAGHRVALAARTEAELEETAAALAPATHLVVPVDLTAAGSVEELFGRVEAQWGPVEILVANAGTASSAPIARVTDEDWQRLLDINLTAPFRCIRRAVPAMTTAGWGRVVVIGSIASRVGAPYIAAYTASKHGVLGLVRSVAAELATTGVTVNAVCPAYVDTPMTDASIANVAARTGRSDVDSRAHFEKLQPIGRLITVREVAAAVLFCVDNGAVTGQGVNVDGGAVQA